MSRALQNAKNCDILREHPLLKADLEGHKYEIRREGDRVWYTVTGPTDSIRVELLWAFGLGAAGQTYVFERDGKWYESRVSFYTALQGLDTTMGAQNSRPANISEAAGRLMDQADVRDCFNCHATNAVQNKKLSFENLIAGVRCERCHGPSEAHVRSVQAGDAKGSAMKKLDALSTEDMSDFCGQCHRTWSQIAMNGPHGVVNVRFQPYRLTNSKCYDAEDKRIRCTSCHDPHGAMQTDLAAYDTKCLACHSPDVTVRKAGAPVCKVQTKDCVSCHMPKTELPGAHNLFTDHLIRVVNAGEKYPD
jgi:Zn finger protein HypA/HybF involved in hydrogenase expression